MSSMYLPLQNDEIRLLTVNAAPCDSRADEPISCTLSHHHLTSSVNQSAPHRKHKGHDHQWPELDVPSNFKVLRSTNRTNLAAKQAERFFECNKSDSSLKFQTHSEVDLPWRYAWGDYIALSYVWGPQAPSHRITVNDVPFNVGPSLHDALTQLRKTERVKQGFKLWIDAICINQSDVSERSQQVALMRFIYASAWQVVTWLGRSANDSNLAITALKWMAIQNRESKPLNGFYKDAKKLRVGRFDILIIGFVGPLTNKAIVSVSRLLTRPYWSRMWILQEVAMARRDAPVYCGEACLSWEDMSQAASLIGRDHERLGRDIIANINTRYMRTWFDFTRDRLVDQHQWSSERTWKLLISISGLQTMQKEVAESGNLLQPLLLSREAACTNEKDHVYGILGIRALAEKVDITPDYTLPLSDIYKSFTLQLLQRGEPDILRLVSRSVGVYQEPRWKIGREAMPLYNNYLVLRLIDSWRRRWTASEKRLARVGPSCNHDVPSWTVCWSCKPIPAVHLAGSYHAGGGLPQPAKHVRDGIIRLKGIVFDKITSLGAFHPGEIGDSVPHNSHSKTSTNAYGTYASARSALRRCLVGNTTSNGSEPSDTYLEYILDPIVWQFGAANLHTNGFGFHEVLARDKDLRLCGYTLEQLILGPERRRSYPHSARTFYTSTKEQREALSWAMNVKAWRRLMGTERGRIGLAPAAARLGDSIAVFLGCRVPMIVRADDLGGWVLIGECFVYGAMYGEVLEEGLRVGDIYLS